MRSKKITDERPCGLYYPEASIVLGGQKIGFPDRLHMQFILSAPKCSYPFVGLGIRFPRKDGNAATFYQLHSGQPSLDKRVDIKFFPGTFTVSGRELSDTEYGALFGADVAENKMSVVHLTLIPGSTPVIEGLGLPFVGATPEIDGYVNSEEKIQGFRSLSDIATQTEFSFIFRDRGILPKAAAGFEKDVPARIGPVYPYGTYHAWDVEHFYKLLPAHLGVTQYPKTYRFDGPNEAQTSLTQSIVQDIFWLIQDVKEIRSIQLDARFIWMRNKPTSNTVSLYMIITLSDEFKGDYVHTLSRMLKKGTPVRIFFRPPLGDNEEGGLFWEGRVMPQNIPDYPDGGNLIVHIQHPHPGALPSHHSHNQKEKVYLKLDVKPDVPRRRVEAVSRVFEPQPARMGNNRLVMMNRLLQDFMMGRGFLSLLDSSVSDDQPTAIAGSPNFIDLPPSRLEMAFLGKYPSLLESSPSDDGISSLAFEFEKPCLEDSLVSLRRDDASASAGSALLPPKVNLIGNIEHAFMGAILSKIRPQTRSRFEQYLEMVPLGLVGIFGSAASGKTEILAVTALIYIANFKLVYASAPTHASTTNFAVRLYRVGREVVQAYNENTFITQRRTLPLVVRGYKTDTELLAFIEVITQESANYLFTHPDRSKWGMTLSLCEWLLKIIQFANFDLDPLDDPALFRIREAFETEDQYAGLRSFVVGDTTWEDLEEPAKESAKKRKPTVPLAQPESASAQSALPEPQTADQIYHLFEVILRTARAICTMPHMSDENPYRKFKDQADAIVLDEAGEMWKADALLVWGDTFRPIAMAGDEKQSPAVMSILQKKDGYYVNRFEAHARTSILEHLARTGHACFVLEN
ncbi:hypothetical protein FZEAL_1782 [Fusarium zealandicum]|uniref:DNA2/NAM7 helicase helicase domain-containing protein n=1 Tax=Fusarium zealandicum TaxID=1053134 RepID=A0A8H4US19_9HYPO|nr:hypothetical protein FZEAL_1782 [Fusarium zealandicum]